MANKKRDNAKAFDEYLQRLDGHQVCLAMFQAQFPDDEFVLVYEANDDRVCAYKRDEFVPELSERSQKIYADDYADAKAKGYLIFFVRDEAKRLLISDTIILPDLETTSSSQAE